MTTRPFDAPPHFRLPPTTGQQQSVSDDPITRQHRPTRATERPHTGPKEPIDRTNYTTTTTTTTTIEILDG